jgi:hypothetical protein
MRYHGIILGLVSVVSAIDTYFHVNADCTGPSMVCRGTAPDVCGITQYTPISIG